VRAELQKNIDQTDLLIDVVVLVDHVVGVLLATFTYYVWQRDRRAGLRSELKFSHNRSYEFSI